MKDRIEQMKKEIRLNQLESTSYDKIDSVIESQRLTIERLEAIIMRESNGNEIPNYLEFQPIHYYTPRGVKAYPFKYTDHDSVKYIREMDGYHLFEMVRGGKVNMVFCKIGFKKN